MSHEKPKTLYGNAKVKDVFGHAIKSYEEWSDTSDCVKDTLTKRLIMPLHYKIGLCRE